MHPFQSSPFKYSLAVGVLASLSLVTAPALACGGLFCSSANPVNQTAERIIFAQDDDGRVTQIVEIMYEGDAEKFAWVLPVPGTPVPSVSSVQVFDRLQAATNPTYQMQTTTTGSCNQRAKAGSSLAFSPDLPSLSSEGAVSVIDSGTVGPFDYETISVEDVDKDPAKAAIEWLDENGYDLGELGADVLRPYLENGLNLIAFRLVKGRSSGSIRPISLEYESRFMAIPIRPTAVAAQEDMGILVWILGESRAVPTNYRSLELNELLIDWFNPGSSYDQVVSAAANEAGGQGFVTEMSGDAGTLYSSVSFPVKATDQIYSESADLAQNMVTLTDSLGFLDGYADALNEHVEFRDEYTASDFISCSSCYFDALSSDEREGAEFEDPIFETELDALRAEIDENVLSPIQETALLFKKYKTVTRLYTTMSADEMSKDPQFDFNSDLGDVTKDHTITREIHCRDDSWVATMENGDKVYGTESVWPHTLDDEDSLSANTRIFQLSTSGRGEVITDNRERISEAHEQSEAGRQGHGCAFSPGGHRGLTVLFASLGLGALLFSRRRSS